jgi:probable RcsB/C two-component-system connector, global regulator of biofilm formation and acid-resistance
MIAQVLITNGAELVTHLSNINDCYEEEKKIFSAAVGTLIAESEEASRQGIMFYLSAEMEISTDVLRLDILRGCLEILMGLKETPGSS